MGQKSDVYTLVKSNNTYLHAIHFIFANDLDGNFTSIALQVTSAIYVTKRTVAHLFDQFPSF